MLNRLDSTVVSHFHRVANAVEAVQIRTDWNPVIEPSPGLVPDTGRINDGMGDVTERRVTVVGPGGLAVDQGALPRAIRPMLDRRDGDVDVEDLRHVS